MAMPSKPPRVATARSAIVQSGLSSDDLPAGRCLRLAVGLGRKDARQIFVDAVPKPVQMLVEEVRRTLEDLVIDLDVALIAQFLHQLGDRLMGHDVVPIALDDQARGRAGGKKTEVIDVGRW